MGFLSLFKGEAAPPPQEAVFDAAAISLSDDIAQDFQDIVNAEAEKIARARGPRADGSICVTADDLLQAIPAACAELERQATQDIPLNIRPHHGPCQRR